jgi:hypothetical protein
VTSTIEKSSRFTEVLSNEENSDSPFRSLKVSRKRQLFSDNESDDLEEPINHKQQVSANNEESEDGRPVKLHKSQTPPLYFQTTFGFKENREGYIDFRVFIF